MEVIWKVMKLATVSDVIDILLVAFLLYRIMRYLRNSSAQRLLQGLLALLVVLQLSDWLQLHIINYILSNLMAIGFLALIVIFQPELRKMLEKVGSGRGIKNLLFRTKVADASARQAISETVQAVGEMSRSKTGALIIFERQDALTAVVNTGTMIDASVNAELIKNIFFPNASLHDGAMIVSDFRIRAAGCILPLSGNLNISKELGTRHRAGLGMSESYDSISVVVSEETGAISLASGGMLKRHLAPETLERLLIKELIPESEESVEHRHLGDWLKGAIKK